jgi:hypothetical protein
MGELILGFILGIITNFVAWWILFHAIVPHIRFSTAISKTSFEATPDDKSGYRYRVKFENAGTRSVIDVEVIARLRIKGLGRYPKTNWQVIDIPVENDRSISYRIPRIQPVRDGHIRHTVRFCINSVEEFCENPLYPEPIRKKAENKTLLLEDLLKSGSKATLRVYAFGYDEFSGTRKLFLSKEYTAEDILEGPFDSRGLEVESPSNPECQNKRLESDEAF